ncbi:MAG: class I SAM-dependent methyltransferase [Micropepsaceae bacterium]
MTVSAATSSLAPDYGRACCGVCGGERFDIVQRQSLELAGLGRHDLAFGICEGCGHLQQAPPVPEAVMLRHYETMSNYTAFSDPAALRAAAPIALTRRLLSLVRDTGRAAGRLYEIGCATGLHLHQFRKEGWSVSGCDPSSLAAQQACDIYEIDVDAGDEASCLPRQSDLDIVMISHVLEHLFDPLAAVKRAHAALADDGLIVLEVPCAIAPELLPPGWFSFEHLHYFSPETLMALLGAAGFEVIEMRIAPHAFIYPVIAVAARKTRQVVNMARRNAANGAAAVARNYAAREEAMWMRAKAKLAGITDEAFIWGAGVHTAQLLHWTGIGDRLTVRGIIDRDAQKWGLMQGDSPVISPDAFLRDSSSAPVIVSSFFAEREIAATLREAGVHPDRIVTLYH